jgi:5-methylcytosine-specific restriction protein A
MPEAPPSFRPAWREPPKYKTDRERGRGTRTERGYSNRWHRARTDYLQRHPLCVHCDGEGRATPATVVDHIVPHKGDDTRFWNEGNWQSLCKPHHDRKSAREGRWGLAHPEGLQPSAIPLAIVCGPPGGGKTTYAQTLGPTVLIDLDIIMAGLGGCGMYEAPDALLVPALVERNNMLQGLSRRTQGSAAFVVSAPSHAERRWWGEQLGVKPIVLDTPLDVCVERINADTRRGDKDRHIRHAKQWWLRYSADNG